MNQRELEKVLKFEPYVIGLFCLGLLLNFFNSVFYEPVILASTSTLTIFYIYKLFRKRNDLIGLERFMRIVLHITLSFGLISLISLLLNWPGKQQIMIVFILITLLVGLIITIKQIDILKIISKKDFFILFVLFLLILSGKFGVI